MISSGYTQRTLDPSPARGQDCCSLSQSLRSILLARYLFKKEYITQLWPETSEEIYLQGGGGMLFILKTEEAMFLLLHYRWAWSPHMQSVSQKTVKEMDPELSFILPEGCPSYGLLFM